MRFNTLLLIIPTILLFCSASHAQGNSTVTRQITFIATDKNGDFVGDIKKEELTVVVDGKEVADFTLSLTTLPSIHVLAIDNSGSLRPYFSQVMNGAKLIFSPNPSNNLTLLMRFVGKDQIQVDEKFSADPAYLESQFSKFRIEGGQTALIEAIYKAILICTQQKVAGDYARAVVVISDGEDRDSRYSQKELKALISQSDIQVFFVGLTSELSKESGIVGKSSQREATEFIEMVTTESGGVAVYPKSYRELDEAGKKIGALLNRRYLLSLQLPDTIGKTSKIEVKFIRNSKREKTKLHFRRSIL